MLGTGSLVQGANREKRAPGANVQHARMAADHAGMHGSCNRVTHCCGHGERSLRAFVEKWKKGATPLRAAPRVLYSGVGLPRGSAWAAQGPRGSACAVGPAHFRRRGAWRMGERRRPGALRCLPMALHRNFRRVALLTLAAS